MRFSLKLFDFIQWNIHRKKNKKKKIICVSQIDYEMLSNAI